MTDITDCSTEVDNDIFLNYLKKCPFIYPPRTRTDSQNSVSAGGGEGAQLARSC